MNQQCPVPKYQRPLTEYNDLKNSFTFSSIIGPKAANDAAADASVIADETEAPLGNPPAAGGGGGGGGGGFPPPAGSGGFIGDIAGVIAGVAKLEGGIEAARDGA